MFFLNYLKGIAIGSGAILPGISSGVLCVIFGLYEKLLNSVLNFFQDWKKNLNFLFPILLGICTGVLLLGKLLLFLLEQYPLYTSYAFIGLILGTLPALVKQINQKRGFRLHYLLYFLFSFLLAIFLLLLENTLPNYETSQSNFFFFILAGFVMSAGVIIPGVSSTILLMLLGVYTTYLTAISSLTFSILVPMGMGLLLGCFLFMKLMQKAFASFPSETYYAILGFVIGSIPILFPSFAFDSSSLIGFILLFICFLIGFLIEKRG